MEIDLIGEIHLYEINGRETPLKNEYWGHGNLKGNERQDSFCIKLLSRDELSIGQKTKASLKFKFRDNPNFEIKISEDEIIELNEGKRKIGEFKIKQIVNTKILK